MLLPKPRRHRQKGEFIDVRRFNRNKPWLPRHPFDPSRTSSESFPEMREEARRFAVRLITAAFRYLRFGEGTDDELAALIGDRSYLSGLPADDPRNLRVKSLLPPAGPDGEGAH